MRFIGDGGGFRIPGLPPLLGGREPTASVEGVPVAPGTAVETAIGEFIRRHSTQPAAPDATVPSPVPPLNAGTPNPMIEPDWPGAPPMVPEQPGPPVIFEPGPPVIFEPGAPVPEFEGPPAPIGAGAPEYFEPGPPPQNDPPLFPGPPPRPDQMPQTPTPENPAGLSPELFEQLRPRSTNWDAPALPGVTGPMAVMGPVLREVLRQVVRRIVRTRPRRPVRRRRVEEPPTWPRRPRRYGEPTPAPQRPPRPQIPRQTPSEPEWTSPYPQIEVPRVPLPAPAIAIPAPVPTMPPARFPAPPVPPTPGGVPWPVSPVPTLPAPQSAPAPAPGAPARTGAPTAPAGMSWPLSNPGLLIASAALSLLLRDARSRSPLLWQSPFTPGLQPAPSPVPSPSVVPSPQTGGLTAINATALPFSQTEAARDRCHCPKPKKGKRRKCRTRYGVVWQSGPKKGELAGSRCLSFVK